MGQKWMDEGEVNVLNIYLKNATQNANLYLGLFTDPVEGSLTEDMSLTDLTEVTGYTRQTLAPADWTITVSTAEQPYKQLDMTGTFSVRGYFITDVVSGTVGNLLTVVYFTTPVSLENGDYIRVKAKITVS